MRRARDARLDFPSTGAYYPPAPAARVACGPVERDSEPSADGAPNGGAARREGAFGFMDTMAKAKTSPFQFLQQVRAEGSKVTWPTRKETMVTTGMVFVMVLLAALFFLVVDWLLRTGVGLVLGLGG